MHVNDVVQLLADYGGMLICRKGTDGAVYITVNFPEGGLLNAAIESSGFDIDAVMTSAKRRIERNIKFRDSVPMGRGKRNK
jgi:hypothetical protein